MNPAPRRSGVSIRRLAPSDARIATRLHGAMPEAWHLADWTGFLREPIVLGLGAFAGGTLIGAVLVRTVAGEGEILMIVVAADWRRGGIGRMLLDAAHAEAAKSGTRTVFLEVAVDNMAAISLYRNFGFVEISRRRGYYRRPGGRVDALLMRLG